MKFFLSALFIPTIAVCGLIPGDFVHYQETDGNLNFVVTPISEFVREITVEGTFDQGENIEYFGVTPENPQTPFMFRMRYDTTASDSDPAGDFGDYDSPFPATLDFGAWHFESPDSSLRIWSGRDGFHGFTFGSETPFEQNGLSFVEYNGLYVSFRGGGESPLAPTDELHWLEDQQANVATESNAYAKINGTIVPEANAGTLFAFGCLFLALLHRR